MGMDRGMEQDDKRWFLEMHPRPAVNLGVWTYVFEVWIGTGSLDPEGMDQGRERRACTGLIHTPGSETLPASTSKKLCQAEAKVGLHTLLVHLAKQCHGLLPSIGRCLMLSQHSPATVKDTPMPPNKDHNAVVDGALIAHGRTRFAGVMSGPKYSEQDSQVCSS